jgi:hypothetical protein
MRPSFFHSQPHEGLVTQSAEIFFIAAAAAADASRVWSIPPQRADVAFFDGIDTLTNIALRAAMCILEPLPSTVRADMGIVIGTSSGSLEMDRIFDRSCREAGGRYASPAAFSRTLPSTAAAEIALRFGIHGPSLTLVAGAFSTALAIRRGVAWMRHMNLEYVLAGGIEWLTPPANPDMICQAAFILLASVNANAIATGKLSSARGQIAGGVRDLSLQKLAEWISEEQSADLGGGVTLTRLGAVSADQ